MPIRKAKPDEWLLVVDTAKNLFPFEPLLLKSKEEIVADIKRENALVVVAQDAKIVGGLLAYKTCVGKNCHARIKCFFVQKDAQWKGTEAEMLLSAENWIGEGKVEIVIADNQKVFCGTKDKNDEEFFKTLGYKREGFLTDHYAKGVGAIVLGKHLG